MKPVREERITFKLRTMNRNVKKSELSEKEKNHLKDTVKGIAAIAILVLLISWIKKKWGQSHISDKFIIITILVMGAIAAQMDNGRKIDETNIYGLLLVVIAVMSAYFYLKYNSDRHNIEGRIDDWLNTKSDIQKIWIYIGFGFGYGILWVFVFGLILY